MSIYIIYLALLSIGACVEKFKLKNNTGTKKVYIKSVVIFFELGILFLMSGMRSEEVGRDVLVYKGWFRSFQYIDVKNFRDSGYTSPGYFLLNKFTMWLGLDFRGFIWIYSFIAVMLLGFIFYNYSQNFSLSLFYFITIGGLQSMFCVMRQAMAGMFIMLAYCLYNSGKKKTSMVAVIIAFSFHISAVICVLLFIPFFLKNKKAFWVYITVLFLGIIFISVTGNTFLLQLYASDRGYLYDATSQGGSTFLFMLLIINFICIFAKNFLKVKYDNFEELLMMVLIIGNVIQFMALSISIISRLLLYFTAFYSLLIPQTASRIRRSDNRAVYVISTMVIFLMFFIYSLNADAFGIVPYKIN